MSDMKNTLKDKIRKSSVHSQLMEPINLDSEKEENVNTNENVNVNVNTPRRRKQKFEELYTRQTYYIKNDILDKFLKAAGDEKGEKTRIINEALALYLDTVV